MQGPFIQMRKTLRTDPRVAAAAAKLQKSRAEIIGGLFLLWCLGDEHGETLRGMSKQMLDAEVGIPGFSDSLPAEWLQERYSKNAGNAEPSLHLPNYVRKNESTERTRSLTRERVRRFRERQKEGGNGVTSLHDPPDQTSPTKTREDKKTHQPTTDDRRAVVAYAREVLGLDLTRLVVVEEVLLDFGLVAVVEVLEHLASRKPSERLKGITNPTGFLKSLFKKAEKGALTREHDFESFETWKARADARTASIGAKR